MKNIFALACGALFGFGLAISGMTDTTKVIGFLDLFGQWVPDLMFVMGAALIVSTIGFAWVLGKSSPIFSEKFWLPEKVQCDRPLILGAVLFGIGWGLYGYCPGPAIAAIAYLDYSSLVFIAAMFSGMALYHFSNMMFRKA